MFPSSPDKGDLFVRVDSLPNKLYKYSGTGWIVLDKETTDTYLNEDYVQHLTDQVAQGHVDSADLTEQEQVEVENELRKRNSSN